MVAVREATAVGRITPDGVLHAVEIDRGWVRPMCQKVWRTNNTVETFDYRYRERNLCHHAACEIAFREQLRDD